MSTTEKNRVGEKANAEAKEAEAKAKLQQAKMDATKAKAEMDTISGVAAAKERVKEGIAGVKAFAAADLAETKADFKRVHDRVAAWDAARAREFDAELEAADAQLTIWKSETQARQAEVSMQRQDDIAALEEKIAVARACAAEAKLEKYTAKAQAALEEAAREFDKAYDAASKRYNLSTARG